MLGAAEVVLEMLSRSIVDEERHARLCAGLAARYQGSGDPANAESPMLAPGSVKLAAFPSEPPPVASALRIATMCCLNETIATVWLKHCYAIATSPLAREANRIHLREEMDRARLGWAHLASNQVSAEARRAIGERLPRMLAANVPGWFGDDDTLSTEGLPEHGIPSSSATKDVVLDALQSVVLPGFAEVGIEPSPGTRWVREFRQRAG